MTHTKGPWKAVDSLSRWNVTTSDKPRTFNICSVNTNLVEQEANARLIAAAPELLEALQTIVCCVRMNGPAGTTAYVISEERMIAARAAIAKAEGK